MSLEHISRFPVLELTAVICATATLPPLAVDDVLYMAVVGVFGRLHERNRLRRACKQLLQRVIERVAHGMNISKHASYLRQAYTKRTGTAGMLAIII